MGWTELPGFRRERSLGYLGEARLDFGPVNRFLSSLLLQSEEELLPVPQPCYKREFPAPILFTAPFMECSGYGRFTRSLFEATKGNPNCFWLEIQRALSNQSQPRQANWKAPLSHIEVSIYSPTLHWSNQLASFRCRWTTVEQSRLPEHLVALHRDYDLVLPTSARSFWAIKRSVEFQRFPQVVLLPLPLPPLFSVAQTLLLRRALQGFPRPLEQRRLRIFSVALPDERKGLSDLIYCIGNAFGREAEILLKVPPLRLPTGQPITAGHFSQLIEPGLSALPLARRPRVHIDVSPYSDEQDLLLYLMADAYVSTSHAEGFGLAAAMAAALGVPTACPGRDAGFEWLAPFEENRRQPQSHIYVLPSEEIPCSGWNIPPGATWHEVDRAAAISILRSIDFEHIHKDSIATLRRAYSPENVLDQLAEILDSRASEIRRKGTALLKRTRKARSLIVLKIAISLSIPRKPGRTFRTGK